MNLITVRARVYVNYGRWVAECPASCGGARKLQPGESTYHCSECLQVSEIEWPADPDGIWEALSERSAPKNRNWYPHGHEVAVRAGIPHGQSVEDLKVETREHGGA